MEAISFSRPSEWAIILTITIAIGLWNYSGSRSHSAQLAHIPTVGRFGDTFPLLGQIDFMLRAPKLIREGYQKYSVFKVPHPGHRWMIVATRRQAIEDVVNAPNNVLSFAKGIEKTFHMDHTFDGDVSRYHVSVIRSQLNDNLPFLYPVMHEEICATFETVIPSSALDGWTRIPVMETVMQILVRASNRVFIGLPLCRDEDFIQINIDFGFSLMKAATILDLLPKVLHPIYRIFPNALTRQKRQALARLAPIILERQHQIHLNGRDYPEKPNDMLSWLMDKARGYQRELEPLTLRILTANFTSVHTTALTLTQVLFDLAANPTYLSLLREEVTQVVSTYGWTKEATDNMHKMDSFIKESQRMNALGCFSLERQVLTPFTFSDGTVIPAGTMVCVAGASTQLDEANYRDADKFDGLRFLQDHNSDIYTGSNGMVSTNWDFLNFGDGRGACPGRFFVAMALKTIMAYLLLNYDIRLPGGSLTRPPNAWFGTACVPSIKGELELRRRST